MADRGPEPQAAAGAGEIAGNREIAAVVLEDGGRGVIGNVDASRPTGRAGTGILKVDISRLRIERQGIGDGHSVRELEDRVAAGDEDAAAPQALLLLTVSVPALTVVPPE